MAVGPVGNAPESYLVSTPLLLLKAGLVKSKSEAKRLINQGAVEVDNNTVTEPDWQVKIGSVIKVGKRRFVRIVEADQKN